MVVSNIFMFTLGEMIQFDLRIFFRWVGEKPPTSCCHDDNDDNYNDDRLQDCAKNDRSV